MAAIQNYYDIANKVGLIELYLLEKKKKILCLLYNHYQNPQLMVLEKMFKKYRAFAR
jgi:hypothetical protein